MELLFHGAIRFVVSVGRACYLSRIISSLQSLKFQFSLSSFNML